MTKLIIWDFNGTLLDDRDLCIHILNRMLAKRNIPCVSPETYLEIFGFPIIDYYKRAGLCFEEESFEDMAKEYIDQYHPASLSLPLCGGVFSALSAFEILHIPQVILSASRKDLLLEQLDSLGIKQYFQAVLGLENIYAQSKEAIARNWLATQQIASKDMLLIGDTGHDAHVASSLGCPCVLVASGHYSPRRLKSTGFPVLESIHQLIPWMKEEGLCIS